MIGQLLLTQLMMSSSSPSPVMSSLSWWCLIHPAVDSIIAFCLYHQTSGELRSLQPQPELLSEVLRLVKPGRSSDRVRTDPTSSLLSDRVALITQCHTVVEKSTLPLPPLSFRFSLNWPLVWMVSMISAVIGSQPATVKKMTKQKQT